MLIISFNSHHVQSITLHQAPSTNLGEKGGVAACANSMQETGLLSCLLPGPLV